MKSSFGQTQKNQIIKGQVPFRFCFFAVNTINMLVYMVYIYAIFYQVNLYPYYQLAIVIVFYLSSLINVMAAKNLNESLLKISKVSCYFVGFLHLVLAVLSLTGLVIYHNSGEDTKNLFCTIILLISVCEIFLYIFNFKYFKQLILQKNNHFENQQTDAQKEQEEENESDSQGNENQVKISTQYLLNGVGYQHFL